MTRDSVIVRPSLLAVNEHACWTKRLHALVCWLPYGEQAKLSAVCRLPSAVCRLTRLRVFRVYFKHIAMRFLSSPPLFPTAYILHSPHHRQERGSKLSHPGTAFCSCTERGETARQETRPMRTTKLQQTRHRAAGNERGERAKEPYSTARDILFDCVQFWSDETHSTNESETRLSLVTPWHVGGICPCVAGVNECLSGSRVVSFHLLRNRESKLCPRDVEH